MKPIALTVGEPAGIGPDIILQLWQKNPTLFAQNKIVIIGNHDLLQERAAILKIDFNNNLPDIIDIPLTHKVTPGKLDSKNAA